MPCCGECETRWPGKSGALVDGTPMVTTVVATDAPVAPASDPVGVPEPQQEGETRAEVDVEDIATEEEADRILPEGARKSPREEAASLFHQLRHKPKLWLVRW